MVRVAEAQTWFVLSAEAPTFIACRKGAVEAGGEVNVTMIPQQAEVEGGGMAGRNYLGRQQKSNS